LAVAAKRLCYPGPHVGERGRTGIILLLVLGYPPVLRRNGFDFMVVWLLVAYCVLILLASLAGGWIPMFVRLTHTRMQIGISFVAGLMLGVGLLHMLPHAIHEVGLDHIDQLVAWLLAGFLLMFFVERFFCFHHHELPAGHGHDEADHSHQEPEHGHGGHTSHELTWSGAAVGLVLHSVLAGVALAASVQAEWHGGKAMYPAGIGVFLVIFLHKPFDAMTLLGLMSVGHWSMKARHLVNGLFAMAIPAGVLLFYAGIGATGHVEGGGIAYALAFSAGVFLCIAMSDLLPELQFHHHDRGALSIALILGLALAWGIGLFESQGHGQHHDDHRDDAPPALSTADHEEHGHDHDHDKH
jgi:zinc and cadmium transporter